MEYIAQYLLLRPDLAGQGTSMGLWGTCWAWDVTMGYEEPSRADLCQPYGMDVKTFTEKHGKTTELVNCGIIKMETSWNILGGRNGRGCWNLMQWLQLVQQLNVVIQLQLCRHEQILNPTHFCFCRPNNLGKNIGVPISCFLGSLKDLALYTTSSLDQQNCFISTVDTCISGWNSSTMTERFRQDGSLYQRMAQDYGSFPPFWDG